MAALDVAVEVVGPAALIVGLMADVDRPAPGRFDGREDVDDLPIWHVHGVFRQPQPVPLMKNLAVIAGLLFYAVSGPGAWSRTGLRRA